MTNHMDAAERRSTALSVHLAGATYEAIAQAVGYRYRATAHRAVQDALTALGEAPGVSQAVTVELARLDAMLLGLWGRARKGDVAAVDRVLRIGERRTQLLQSIPGTEPANPQRTALDELRARRAGTGRTDASDRPL
jgi:hypothetical protein